MFPKHTDRADNSERFFLLAGDLLFPLRLVVGWTYFSAFWRRLILENKLDPDTAGYIGEKFNHFLPNAFVIKPVIEFFVTHPVLLWWKLLAFTLVEAAVGFALLAGLATRLAGLVTSLLAFGILLGAGWLGTTCLDEWQIGVLGIAAGLACLAAGGGHYSADYFLTRRCPKIKESALGRMLLGQVPEAIPYLSRMALIGGVAVFALTLLTNQVFHGGVWGPLHNKSVRPKLELTEARVDEEGLRFTVERVEGADVYGSFLVAASLRDADGHEKAVWSGEALSKLPVSDIANRYVARIKPGAYSLVLPLGAKAEILLRNRALNDLPKGTYTLVLVDVSGLKWTVPVKL